MMEFKKIEEDDSDSEKQQPYSNYEPKNFK